MSSRSFSTNDRVRNDAQTERSTESTVPRTTLQGLSNGVPAISVNGSGVYLDIQSVFSAVFSNPKWVYLPKKHPKTVGESKQLVPTFNTSDEKSLVKSRQWKNSAEINTVGPQQLVQPECWFSMDLWLNYVIKGHNSPTRKDRPYIEDDSIQWWSPCNLVYHLHG
jgi:hypothetical protein